MIVVIRINIVVIKSEVKLHAVPNLRIFSIRLLVAQLAHRSI